MATHPRVRQFLRKIEREARQAEELAHEERLAAIRARSRALIWTGPENELIEAISRFYDSGWISATTLDDALEKAAVHFVKPDGKPVIKAPSTTPRPLAKYFTGEHQTLMPKSAQSICYPVA